MHDSTIDTMEHKQLVKELLSLVQDEIEFRKNHHDDSKLNYPEKELFDIFSSRLKNMEYNSIEYKQSLKELKPALEHHYSVNSHHPEHYENGVNGMNLIDLIEMICNWKASSLRNKNGDIRESIKINKDRFNMSEQLCDILNNTVDYLIF